MDFLYVRFMAEEALADGKYQLVYRSSSMDLWSCYMRR